MTIEQFIQRLDKRVVCSLKHHTIELDGIELKGRVKIEPFDAVSLIEQIWQRYYSSVPDSKNFSPLPAKPRQEYEYLDFVTAENRSEIQWVLEVVIVATYWTKSFPTFKGWYWRSPRYPKLVLFKQWLQ